MKFTLAYDGPLPSQNARHIFDRKWQIRKILAPQLVDLWSVHPGLKRLNRYLPRGGYFHTETHHSTEATSGQDYSNAALYLDLGGPIEVSGIPFLPLIRESYALTCSLNILFLRKEPAGNVYSGGDLDNRIKTFLDALKVPQSEADSVAKVFPKPTEPIHCLLEDDSLITGLSVQSDRLLGEPSKDEGYVRLVVDVDIRVIQPKFYNQLFLGD